MIFAYRPSVNLPRKINENHYFSTQVVHPHTKIGVSRTGPSARKDMRKSLFFHAGGAPAHENRIFTCGCLCSPHTKINIRKKIAKIQGLVCPLPSYSSCHCRWIHTDRGWPPDPSGGAAPLMRGGACHRLRRPPPAVGGASSRLSRGRRRWIRLLPAACHRLHRLSPAACGSGRRGPSQGGSKRPKTKPRAHTSRPEKMRGRKVRGGEVRCCGEMKNEPTQSPCRSVENGQIGPRPFIEQI